MANDEGPKSGRLLELFDPSQLLDASQSQTFVPHKSKRIKKKFRAEEVKKDDVIVEPPKVLPAPQEASQKIRNAKKKNPKSNAPKMVQTPEKEVVQIPEKRTTSHKSEQKMPEKKIVQKFHKGPKVDRSEKNHTATPEPGPLKAPHFDEISEEVEPDLPRTEPLPQKRGRTLKHYRHFKDFSHICQKENDSADSEEISSDSIDEVGEDNGPDMSWILDDSSTEEENKKERKEESVDPFRAIRNSLELVIFLGRLPFHVTLDKKTGRFGLEAKNLLRNLDLLLLILLLGFVTLLCGASIANILFGDPNTSKEGQYLNFERLLLQKHWLYVTIFLMTIVVALVGSLTIFLKKETHVNFFNLLGQNLLDLKYGENVAENFRLLSALHILSTVLNGGFLISLIISKTGGFGEGQKFQTLLITRWFSTFAWFGSSIDYTRWIVMIWEIYVYLLARNVIAFVLIPCFAVSNAAENWNFRVKVLLSKIPPSEATILAGMLNNLNYDGMLKEHFIIAKSVRQISTSFTTIIPTFFALKVLAVCCELFRFSTAFLFDLGDSLKSHLKRNTVPFTTSDGKIIDTGIKYASSSTEEMLELLYFSLATLVGLLVAANNISAVGETVMRGFSPIRRYGLVLAKNVTERKFILSLQMSFNSAKPYVVNPGSWFGVDRSLIVGIFGTSFLIFSIMIQCQVVNLVDVPIVLPCPDSKKICTKTITVHVQSRENLNEVISKKVEQIQLPIVFLSTSKPAEELLASTEEHTSSQVPSTTEEAIITTTPTTTTTTTTTKPPVPPPKPKPCESGSGVINANNLPEKCYYYCHQNEDATKPHQNPLLSYVRRYHAYNKNNRQLKSPMEDTLKCITEPFSLIKNNKEIYNCHGKCHNDPDDLGNYGLGSVALQNHGGINCYSPDPSNPDFHPLEICGIPYPYFNKKITTLKDMIVDPWADLSLFDTRGAICLRNIPPSDPTRDFRLLHIFDYSGNRIFRLKAYSFLYSKTHSLGIEIPMTFPSHLENLFEKSIRLLAYPYAYLHPKFSLPTKNTKGETTYKSFGYHDCFGNPLEEFDDCGGLPFSIQETGIDRIVRKPKLMSFVVGSENKNCWESWIPDYICGAPADNDRLRIQICKDWAEYLADLNPK